MEVNLDWLIVSIILGEIMIVIGRQNVLDYTGIFISIIIIAWEVDLNHNKNLLPIYNTIELMEFFL